MDRVDDNQNNLHNIPVICMQDMLYFCNKSEYIYSSKIDLSEHKQIEM